MSFRAWGDSRGNVRLLPSWSTLMPFEHDTLPIERTDLLDQAKLFGDVHRASKFRLHQRITPIIDVTAQGEQVPTFYSTFSQAAGGVGTFAAVELANPNLSFTIGRPKLVRVKVFASADTVAMFAAPHQFLGGAPASGTARLTDTRRGIGGGVGNSALTLQGSAVAGNVPPVATEVFRITVPLGADYVELLWEQILKYWIIGPAIDLVFCQLTANEGLEVSAIWSEEPVSRATRGQG